MLIRFIVIPLIGAFIGWITNVLAIKLIFWPYEPVRVPLTGWEIYGLIPKRRREIASNIGRIVEEELFSIEDFLLYLKDSDIQEKLLSSISEAVKSVFSSRVPRFVPGYFKDILSDILQEILKKELPFLLDRLSAEIEKEIRARVEIRKIIEDRINGFDVKALENLILQVSSRELRHIEFLGGVIGFAIGLFQSVITLFI